MNLVLFLYIAAFFTLTFGEFGQFPFGQTSFSISVTDILLTLALSAVLIWNVGIRKSLVLPRNFIYLMMFWGICLISLLFSLDLSGGFYLIRFIIYSATFYLTFHLVKSRILGLGEFLNLVKITAITLATIGIFQLIFFPDLESLSLNGYDPHKFRIFSTFLDPNFLGTFLTFSFILTLYELVTKEIVNISYYLRENRWNLIWLVILGTTIIFTFSRSAYLMLAVSLLIILSVKNRKLLLIFVILSIILYFSFPEFNKRIDGAINIDASAVTRFSSWDKGLVIFQDNPILGVGFNNVRNYSQGRNLIQLFSVDGGNSGSGIDSSLIFIMATTGLIGFISFATLLYKILSDFISGTTVNLKTFYSLQLQQIKVLKRIFELPVLIKWYNEGNKKNPARKNSYSKRASAHLSLPLLSLALGFMANSFFINSLFYPPILFLWFSLIGLYYGLGEGEGDGS